MSVSQQEFNAFKAALEATALTVTADIARLKEVADKADADAVAANGNIVELQQSYSQISLQAAPWSATIQAKVAVSEANSREALNKVSALHDATRAEVTELKRRADEMEKKSSGHKEWGLTRAKDMVPDVFSGKEDGWAKFKDSVIDYAESCHDGLKTQLDCALKQKQEITQAVLSDGSPGTTDKLWALRFELYKLLKLKTELNSEARKIVECIGDGNGYEVWRLLGVRYEANHGTKDLQCWQSSPTCRIRGAKIRPRLQ